MTAPTVLIVDDEVRVLDALEAILAAEFRVVRAAGGEAALDLLRVEDIAVIVTDYRMPGMTGVELLRRSQEHAPEAVRITGPSAALSTGPPGQAGAGGMMGMAGGLAQRKGTDLRSVDRANKREEGAKAGPSLMEIACGSSREIATRRSTRS